MDSSKSPDKNIREDLAGIAAGYDRYAKRESILDHSDESPKEAEGTTVDEKLREEEFGISAGFDKFEVR